MTRRIPLFLLYPLIAVFDSLLTNDRLLRPAMNIVGALPLKSYPCNLDVGMLGTLTPVAGLISLVPLTWET